MRTLIVCVPRDVRIEEVRDQLLARNLGVDFQDGRIAVSHGGSLAWVEPDLEGELEREYQPDELTLIEGFIGQWDGFGIDYRSVEVADAVVAVMCECWPCVVDDDDGFIGWGRDYLERRHGAKGT